MKRTPMINLMEIIQTLMKDKRMKMMMKSKIHKLLNQVIVILHIIISRVVKVARYVSPHKQKDIRI